MKTIAIMNLKGGVGKTISATNIAHILAVLKSKKVLLIDNDKQGNASKMFNVHDYEFPSISELITERGIDIQDIIRKTNYENLDIIPANMTLLNANIKVILDTKRPQQTRLSIALKAVENKYDYCIIDNAPDFNMSTINALVAADEVMIPIKIDKFAFDGLDELKDQIENIKEDLNPKLELRGCFVTSYQNNGVNRKGKEDLKQKDIGVFETHIRKTEKVDESTFESKPIIEHSKRCGAARDYINLVEEYLEEK